MLIVVEESRLGHTHYYFVKMKTFFKDTTALEGLIFLYLNDPRFEPRHEISNNVVCATSKASDQPAHTRSLIRAFASRLNILFGVSKLKRRLHRLV